MLRCCFCALICQHRLRYNLFQSSATRPLKTGTGVSNQAIHAPRRRNQHPRPSVRGRCYPGHHCLNYPMNLTTKSRTLVEHERRPSKSYGQVYWLMNEREGWGFEPRCLSRLDIGMMDVNFCAYRVVEMVYAARRRMHRCISQCSMYSPTTSSNSSRVAVSGTFRSSAPTGPVMVT